jgi:uncharacterized protein YkwD
MLLRHLCLCIGLSCLLLPSLAHANLLREINEARAEGCGGHKGVAAPVRANPKLDQIARRVARGQALREAMRDVAYRPVKSSLIRLSGWLTESSIARSIGKQFCASLIDRSLNEIGIYRKGNAVWIVMAQALSPPAPRDANAVSRRVLDLTNKARSEGRLCGSDYFAAAGPLTLSPALYAAALEHSRDMARRNYFEHRGLDGSQPADRVTRTGYRWRVVGENLAAGITTPEETVAGWISSPHHCANLMDGRFTQMGVAYAVDESSDMAIYWTQVFALPR